MLPKRSNQETVFFQLMLMWPDPNHICYLSRGRQNLFASDSSLRVFYGYMFYAWRLTSNHLLCILIRWDYLLMFITQWPHVIALVFSRPRLELWFVGILLWDVSIVISLSGYGDMYSSSFMKHGWWYGPLADPERDVTQYGYCRYYNFIYQRSWVPWILVLK